MIFDRFYNPCLAGAASAKAGAILGSLKLSERRRPKSEIFY
jgi:hypothetical protein